MKKPLKIWFDEPAEDSDEGWEKRSFPMANGYMGVNLFGGLPTERLQITESSLITGHTPYVDRHWSAGLENFAEVYIDFPYSFEDVTDYKRELSLDTATATVEYSYRGVKYTRETFGSYPDKVFVTRITASKSGALDFTLRPVSPYNRDCMLTEGDGCSRHGKCEAKGDTVIQSGISDFYGVQFEGQYKIVLEGEGNITAAEEALTVNGATCAVIYIAVGTNYVLSESIFTRLDDKSKLRGLPHPHEKISAMINDAVKKGFGAVKESHLSDYTKYFSRQSVDFGGYVPSFPTDVMKEKYTSGEDSNPYCIELIYQMGRYVMISTSRENCLPPNLQGKWSCFKMPPWTSGYWYNINIQMNYWGVFTSNLAEMFSSYEQFNRARMKSMQNVATAYVKENLPENHVEGQGMDGYIVGTGNSAYTVAGVGGHSGPGTGGLMTKAYWDYYEFTKDKDILKNDVYPMLEGMARFYTKFAQKQADGKYLCKISSSPEQYCGTKPYTTVGCGFDQQMMYENNRDFLRAAEILGDDPIVDRELVSVVKEQIDKYDPVNIGYNGQIKEYREEKYYGDIINESGHRHISQLACTAPGTQVSSDTPAWLDAAAVSLRGRGETFVGWANVHRMMVWARTGNSDMCAHIVDKLAKGNVFPNLLSGHNPDECFQVDAVLGITAAIAETLMQSQNGYLYILPALNPAWKNGSVKGLSARGGFDVSFSWKNGMLDTLSVLSKCGGKCVIKYPTAGLFSVDCSDGRMIYAERRGTDTIEFDTEKGCTYIISDIEPYQNIPAPEKLTVDASDRKNVKLSWTPVSGVTYTVLRADGDEPRYKTLASGITACEYTDTTLTPQRATYKAVSEKYGTESKLGAICAVVPEGEEQKIPEKFGRGAGTFKKNCW